MGNEMIAEEMDLCQMQIVLPTESTEVEKTAAFELQKHIIKICNVDIPIVSENCDISNIKSVYVGATMYAADHHVVYPNNTFEEGWSIRAVEGNLVLCGGRVRGVLYAVYHLLEDVFGVHWWNLWEEHIPSLSSAIVPYDYSKSGVPAFEYRDAFFWVGETDSLFAVRNRLNGFACKIPPAYGGMEDFGPPAHVHTYNRYFPENGSEFSDVDADWSAAINPDNKKFYFEHPEWFALTDRNKRIPGILCMSNEELQQAFADLLLKSIEYSYAKADASGEARPRYFDVSPSDMPFECRCPKCKASIQQHGSSGHQLIFVNKMAEIVHKKYPEVRIETLSYWNYLAPPKDDTKPNENVVVRYCNDKMDVLHSIMHKNNKQFLEGLKSWTDICGKGQLYIWDYAVVYSPHGIFPSMYKFGTNFKTFKELGVNGYFLEVEQCITSDFWDMKVWLSSKLMEDPEQDLRTLMDTFINGYYGAAGPYVRLYLDFMNHRAEQHDGYYSFNTNVINADGISVEDIIVSNQFFENAFVIAGSNEVLCKRLRHACMGLKRVIFENYERLSAEAMQKTILWPFDKQEVGKQLAEIFTEQVELRGDWDPTGVEAKKLYEKYLLGCVAEESFVAGHDEALLAKILGCADGWKGQSPIIVEETELETIPKEQLYVFSAGVDFASSKTPLIEDNESPAGISSWYDVAYRKEARLSSDQEIQVKWSLVDDDNARVLPLGVYSGDLDNNGSPISSVWGTIRAKDIIADGKYHLYKFSDVIAIPKANTGAFHMFRNWGLQIYAISWELAHLEGKPVDCYISMKVMGDVSCEDSEDMPVYCIDRVIVADKKE